MRKRDKGGNGEMIKRDNKNWSDKLEMRKRKKEWRKRKKWTHGPKRKREIEE